MIGAMPGRLALALVAGVLALGGSPAQAAPTTDEGPPPVIVQRSIRGVQLGMDPARVRELLDRAPDSSRTDPHPIVERTKTWTFGALKVVFDGTKAGARVISVSTTSRVDRTPRGVGVGSKEMTVRRRVAGVDCRTEYGYRRCSIGKQVAGEPVTDFSISSKGRVWRIALSRVLD